jgi:hypothetical protein
MPEFTAFADFEQICIAEHAVDEALTDEGTVGPETAYLAQSYLRTPRALLWHNPSPDWKLFVVVIPLATRLSMLRNPIFGQLVRDWGMGVRFLGISAEQQVFDFRRLLDPDTLNKLIHALTVLITPAPPVAKVSSQPASANEALDILFATLAKAMLTMLDARRLDWPLHLAREHRLELASPDSLLDRASRFPDFTASLQFVLRQQIIDLGFYGKVLRSIDARERSAEQVVTNAIINALNPNVMQSLRTLRIGLHLGCYNWLLENPAHREQRFYALLRLPTFAQFFCDALIRGTADEAIPVYERAPILAKAIDSGQDRQIVRGLSINLGVNENTIRALWRNPPLELESPPAWLLAQIVQQLDATPERDWPRSAKAWLELSEAVSSSTESLE